MGIHREKSGQWDKWQEKEDGHQVDKNSVGTADLDSDTLSMSALMLLTMAPFTLPIQGGFTAPIRCLAVPYKLYKTSVGGSELTLFKLPGEVVTEARQILYLNDPILILKILWLIFVFASFLTKHVHLP